MAPPAHPTHFLRAARRMQTTFGNEASTSTPYKSPSLLGRLLRSQSVAGHEALLLVPQKGTLVTERALGARREHFAQTASCPAQHAWRETVLALLCSELALQGFCPRRIPCTGTHVEPLPHRPNGGGAVHPRLPHIYASSLSHVSSPCQY